MSTILEMKSIYKSFGVPVLKNVNFNIEKGEVTALVGGNGAGKSTLMKIMTGVYTKDSGSIFIDGKECEISNIQDAKKLGLGMIFQEFSLIPTMTVTENIFLGNEILKSKFVDNLEMSKKATDILETLGISLNLNQKVGKLGVGMQQMVEIAKALSQNSKILVFDEPTASLSDFEIDLLFKVIKSLKNKGISIVYISHRMNEILQICDKVSVLRDGEIVLSEDSKNLSLDDIIIAMMGEKNNYKEWTPRKYDKMNTLLEIKNLKINDRINDISFNLKKGEIVGFAGLMGSGRTEILETLFGIRKKIDGEIILEGKNIDINSTTKAIYEGIALIPEDRRSEGLIISHSIKENSILPSLVKYQDSFLVNEKKADIKVKENISELKIKAKNINQRISLLSGGNQQKVVIAKWVNINPKIMMLDEPTSGIDIKAKTEIIDLMKRIADNGNGIIFVSSELTELMSICDKIYVIHNGKIINKYYRNEINNEEILQHAIQGN